MPVTREKLTSTRQTLLSRLKNWDDSESWREFFNSYWNLIFGVAIQSGLTEIEAQEVVQETMIAVAKSMPKFKYDPARGSFKRWLLQLTRWRILDQFRKRGRRENRANSNGLRTESGTSPIERIPDPEGSCLEAAWDREWEQCVLDRAMDRVRTQVPPKQYQIFDLHVVKRWPVEKVAATLGINRGQVYLAKHRVGASIKKEVKRLEKEAI